jgi:hypothetical protein
MREIQPSELAEILRKHELWLIGEPEGESANLSEANLSEANLSGANLRWANLIGANLRGANLSEANLSEANLSWANIIQANLRGANLSDANLREASLSGANLSGANIWRANLSGANLSRTHGVYSMQLSKHPIVVWFDHESNTHMVKVGCMEFSIENWLKHSESIGVSEGYSQSQIQLYLNAFTFLKNSVDTLELNI